MQLIRLLTLRNALQELGRRAWALRKWGASLAPAGPEEGIIVRSGIRALASEIFGECGAAVILGVSVAVVAAFVIGLVVTSVVIPLALNRNIPVPPMPSGIPSFWSPNSPARLLPDYSRYQRALSSGHDLITDYPSEDRQKLTDVQQALVGQKRSTSSSPSLSLSAPVSQSLPRHNSGGNYSVQISDGLDDAALQLQRLRAIQSGDINGYNNLLQQHGQQIKESGRDPGSSGFYPGQKSK
jgi:hypothetical protein